MTPEETFTMGDFVAGQADWGKADGVADHLTVNSAYLIIGMYKNGFVRLLEFTEPVDPQYLRMATAREITDTKKKYIYSIPK